MARLNILKYELEGGDLPDLGTILQSSGADKGLQRTNDADVAKMSNALLNSSKPAQKVVQKRSYVLKEVPKTQRTAERGTLGSTCSNSRLPSCAIGVQDEAYSNTPLIRSTPKRAIKKHINYSIFSATKEQKRISMSEDDESFTDLSGFIVPDSESEDEIHPSRAKSRKPKISSIKAACTEQSIETHQTTNTVSEGSDLMCYSSTNPKHLDAPGPPSKDIKKPSQTIWQSSNDSLELENDFSQLRSSPPRSRKPSKVESLERPITPPLSPSKATLGSPSKRHRIPPSPHRPSIDAFWNPDVINDWNDQNSPKKTPHTPGRNRLLPLDEEEESSFSPSSSPRKSPVKSPSKKERQALKVFHQEKTKLATSFLSELDEKITDSRICSLTALTGGTKIVWSRKLASTAGRANWRREAVRRKSPDGTFFEPTYRHHASIELAEKVIDCEDRLINVLAHEYCHLANFMISGIKDQPHGKEFKAWAAKVTRTFKNRGVEVTTKHGYDITYKYAWTCGDCGLDYKRHSKSIDPAKHSCGVCKGKLTQVLPAPRKESEYQRFVKANWDRMKKTAGEGAGMGEINGLLAKEWEAKKNEAEKSKQVVVEVVEVTENAGNESDKMVENLSLDKVARKLDFLTLGA